MFLGWITFVFVLRLLLAVVVINALLMIFSPAAWHKTPWWFRSVSGIPAGQDPLSRSAVRIRMVGGVLLLAVVALAYSIYCRPRPESSVRIYKIDPVSHR